ncbi:ubiquitin-like-specific protease ESD4 [Actinidia eriantha]|uniref:ubiquitin-like-specific protease ESD4 n=1 Tax=Actinidia eriantha TaxID=165200 RepID=UPI00258D4002|nr:ubiquitin-like-specific protease ESD4 [Actinidia eriantha]
MPKNSRVEKEEDLADVMGNVLSFHYDQAKNSAIGALRRKVLVTHENSNIQITGEVLLCLRPGAWLYDEVINLYLELLKEREKRELKKFLKCHFFSTFFYKKLDSLSLVLPGPQPLNQPGLQPLILTEPGFDSPQPLSLDVFLLNYDLRPFLQLDEIQLAVTGWHSVLRKKADKGLLLFDCGMFMIKYADFYSRGLGLCFKQEHMPYFRLRTAKEILRLKAE